MKPDPEYPYVSSPILKIKIVPIAITEPNKKILSVVLRFMICSDLDLGGWFMTFCVTGSIPKAIAGGPSINKFIHNTRTGNSGIGRPAVIAKTNNKIAPILVET